MVSRLPRWIRLFVGLTCCCLLSLAVGSPRAGGAERLRTAPSGVLALRNSTWDRIQIEIRLGPSSQCDLYPSLAVRTLRRGEVWAVVADEVVCWRRETSPGAAPIAWTPWQARQVPSAGVDDVTL